MKKIVLPIVALLGLALRGLGNAVVPQVAEWIGRRIVAYHESLPAAAAAA